MEPLCFMYTFLYVLSFHSSVCLSTYSYSSRLELHHNMMGRKPSLLGLYEFFHGF